MVSSRVKYLIVLVSGFSSLINRFFKRVFKDTVSSLYSKYMTNFYKEVKLVLGLLLMSYSMTYTCINASYNLCLEILFVYVDANGR